MYSSGWSATPSQLFSYYPKYEYLDSVLSASNRKKLNLYVDFKSCGQALFQEWGVRYILSQSDGTDVVDTSLFAAILEFVSFHKVYAKKRQIDLNIYFFMESGKSSYHLNIHKEYKAKRGISEFFGLDDAQRDRYYKILDKNYSVCDRVLNKVPNVYFIRLMYLEADFIPWYLMKEVLNKEDVDSAANIIYSTDKDMFQCLDGQNNFQFYRHYKNVKMLTHKDIYNQWLKIDFDMSNSAEWFPLILSIVGDSGDGFDGIGGIGPKRVVDIFEKLKVLCFYSMNEVYSNIRNKQSIFNKNYLPNKDDKALQKVVQSEDIIIRNLKLSSYALLSEAVNGGYPTDMISKKNQITSIVNNQDKWKNPMILNSALNRSGLLGLVTESTLANLF
jgi:hypothetical protein